MATVFSRLFAFAVLSLSVGAAEITYWIQPCEPGYECQAADAALAKAALATWQHEEPSLTFRQVTDIKQARFRFVWVNINESLYGEARPFVFAKGLLDDVIGYQLTIRTSTKGLGEPIESQALKDPLLRDAIVYLTCVHETGHALSLRHTANFSDIMYSFQYGGDIGEYFQRYRRRVQSRDDFSRVSPLSAVDRERLHAASKP